MSVRKKKKKELTCAGCTIFIQKLIISTGAHAACWDGQAERPTAPIVNAAHIVTCREKERTSSESLNFNKAEGYATSKILFILNPMQHKLPFNFLFLYFIFWSTTQLLELQSHSTTFRFQDTFFHWDIHGHIMRMDMLYRVHRCGYSQIPPE